MANHEPRHRIQCNKSRCELVNYADRYGPDAHTSSGHSCSETMRNIRYILDKYRHELDEEPLFKPRGPGRLPKLDPQRVAFAQQLLAQQVPVPDIAAQMQISASSVYRIRGGRYLAGGPPS